MINEFNIQNFRGIQAFHVTDLGQVNLLLGYNNCGKSSVLDALFLLAGATNPRLSISVNWPRHYMSSLADEMLKLNFYGLNPVFPIRLSGGYGSPEKTRELTISYQERESEIMNLPTDSSGNAATKDFRLNLDAEIDHQVYHSDLQIKGNSTSKAEVNAPGAESYQEELKCHYISSSDPYSNNVALFSDLLRNKQEEALFEDLREIEPSLRDIVVANNNLMVDVGLEKRIPIQVLGDGIRKLISLFIYLFQARDGILLVDEIDNGLHYKSMPILWKSVLRGADKYNVQVFATTHNIDSLKALNQMLQDETFQSMQARSRVFTLRKTSDCLAAVKSTYPQFRHLINEEIEIR